MLYSGRRYLQNCCMTQKDMGCKLSLLLLKVRLNFHHEQQLAAIFLDTLLSLLLLIWYNVLLSITALGSLARLSWHRDCFELRKSLN